MNLMDKTLVLDFLQMPRLGLSPEQIMNIERIIDGKPAQKPPSPWVSYKDVAAKLGMKTRQGVVYLIKDGVLDSFVLPGRKYAIGVTRESLERALALRAG